MTRRPRTVLFDLDGTLADTAPDLAFVLNTLLTQAGRPILPVSLIRPTVSLGTPGMLHLGFGIQPGDPAFATLRQDFFDLYLDNLVRETRLFPGMADLLRQLEQRTVSWGIVTNKPAFLTVPLVEQLGLSQRAACVISGDTTAHCKPHPAPLLYACEQLDNRVEHCLYVGDARCDIEAGRRAGMRTLVASFGYIPLQENPESWGADAIIDHPLALLDWLDAVEEIGVLLAD